jgi:hypothetical protein
MAIGTTAALIMGASALGAAGIGAAASSQQSKAASKAAEAQQQAANDYTEPQKQQMAAYLPYYKELLPLISGQIKSGLNATTLPEATSQALGRYYDQAGESLGAYGASKNMLNSGVMDRLYGDLLNNKASTQLSTLENLRNTSLNQGMSFIGQTPSQSYVSPTSYVPQSSNIDWSSIGSLLAKFNFGGSPTATSLGGTSNIANNSWATSGLSSLGGF